MAEENNVRRTLADYTIVVGPHHFNSIVRPRVNAANMEVKPSLIQLVKSNQFNGLSHESPYEHLTTFNGICITLKITSVSKAFQEGRKLEDECAKVAQCNELEEVVAGYNSAAFHYINSSYLYKKNNLSFIDTKNPISHSLSIILPSKFGVERQFICQEDFAARVTWLVAPSHIDDEAEAAEASAREEEAEDEEDSHDYD
ncbi:hypothetical protein LR48_Vigan02g085800 [Vigna angularis]|uniref:Uncharacterized protein n=1 Tax=Phaseolus angularis TaxID=3914 RepID=A0A0L9TVU0_PHAAN|nr:hypothetical protein LR48_Vigan02g085800 [Vigna angularis]